jgi:MICOS complex subunit MIC26
VDKWIGIEKQVETTLKEVAPKGEETIIPGAVYVGIAGMGGSILARNRTSLSNVG